MNITPEIYQRFEDGAPFSEISQFCTSLVTREYDNWFKKTKYDKKTGKYASLIITAQGAELPWQGGNICLYEPRDKGGIHSHADQRLQCLIDLTGLIPNSFLVAMLGVSSSVFYHHFGFARSAVNLNKGFQRHFNPHSSLRYQNGARALKWLGLRKLPYDNSMTSKKMRKHFNDYFPNISIESMHPTTRPDHGIVKLFPDQFSKTETQILGL